MSHTVVSPFPLTIAGSDPSGGAGLQADLKVFLRLGLSGAAVPTALTVQSPKGVRRVQPVDNDLVEEQLATVISDVRITGVKVGLLPNGKVIRTVARVLFPLVRKGVPIVVDPVLAASDGTRFLPEEDLSVLIRQLFPLATLITPNTDEAAEILGTTPEEVRNDVEGAVTELRQTGPRNVLITGGHGTGKEVLDVLGTAEDIVVFGAPRMRPRTVVHGTGCLLSAAIAGELAQGSSLEESVATGKAYVTRAIEGAMRVGKGARVLDFLAGDDA